MVGWKNYPQGAVRPYPQSGTLFAPLLQLTSLCISETKSWAYRKANYEIRWPWRQTKGTGFLHHRFPTHNGLNIKCSNKPGANVVNEPLDESNNSNNHVHRKSFPFNLITLMHKIATSICHTNFPFRIRRCSFLHNANPIDLAQEFTYRLPV